MSIYRRIRKTDNSDNQADPVIDLRNDPPEARNQWISMDEPAAEQADQYSAWADRMRNKRSRNQEMINGVSEAEPATYWTTDTVFAESERVAQDEVSKRPDPLVVHSFLRTLQLGSGASAAEIVCAYKRLVKEHHPDMFLQADSDTQAFHDERMREINTAYRALRSLHID